MSTSEITLLKGKKHKLKIVNAPKNAKIKWKTSNKFAVTVSKKGKLKAVNYGTATIKATYKKKNYYCQVTVPDSSKRVTLNTYNVSLVEGSTYQLQPTSAKTVKYFSNNDHIATVNANGLIKAHNPGTVAIAAQAMTNILENLNGIAAIGVGIGLMTVVGQCLGAGRKDEAVYYIKKLSVLAEIIVVASCLLVFALTIPVTKLGGMEPESARMCFHMISWITVVKPIVWTLAFIPAYGLRAAGDVKFSMITSCITMWTFRFCLCVYLIRFRGFGPMAVWIGMFTDWTVRGIVFSLRFHSRKWLKHKVV